MAPKSNKKTTALVSWYYCESCHIHLPSKQRDDHNCQLPTIEYISKGVLFTESVEKRSFSIEELKGMPSRYVNNLIFMSEGAMRLAQLHIGQQVVIKCKHENKHIENPSILIRSLWPIPEKFLTTIFATEDDFNKNWSNLKGELLTIEALSNDCPNPAKNVYLRLEDDVGNNLIFKQLKELENLVKIEMKNFIYTNGSLLHMDFFNKKLKLRIYGWEPVENTIDDSIHCKLQNLTLDSTIAFFKVTNATRVEIDRPKISEIETESIGLVTKNEIGGLEEQLNVIEQTMHFALGFKPISKGISCSRSLLIFGPSGCGKTMICESMCTSALTQSEVIHKTHIIKINSSELFSKFLGETEKNLTSHFERAFQNYPQSTLIIIEDIHNLCPKNETNDIIKRVSVALMGLFDSLKHRKDAQRVFVLTTTSQIEALNPSIRRCGRLDFEVEVGPPTPKRRGDIIRCCISKIPNEISAEEIDQIAQISHGFVGSDLANLIHNSAILAFKSSNQILKSEHIHLSLLHIKPSAMREVLIECPNVLWSDIGGQDELKLKLKQAIEWPLKHADKFKQLGIKPPRGLLMFGPPGCSKTMIAKALATESKLNFLSIKGPELFSMWVGESEKAVREVFRKARQVAPAIVFFDEIDAIGSERSDGSSGGGSSVKERVLTQLLTELDGVETLNDVTIVAATNRPDLIDKALLRPGRIDRIIYVGLPDAAARREIFGIKLNKMPIASDVCIDRLVDQTAGYSGAEIQAVCHEAALKTLEENFDAINIHWQQFEYALNMVKPRTSPELLCLYDEYLNRN